MVEEIEKEIWKIREKTFTKKDKEGHMCNEWVDCLSFNDDIFPLIKILDKYNNQENKYKNAWNELKEDCREVEKANDYILYERLQELEQKYNLKV